MQLTKIAKPFSHLFQILGSSHTFLDTFFLLPSAYWLFQQMFWRFHSNYATFFPLSYFSIIVPPKLKGFYLRAPEFRFIE